MTRQNKKDDYYLHMALESCLLANPYHEEYDYIWMTTIDYRL